MTIVREFSELAVESIAAYIESGFNAQLRIVETNIGLTAMSLPNYGEICRGQTPMFNAWPHIEVWEERIHTLDILEHIYEIVCKIGLAIVGDADAIAGQLMSRRYQTAMLRLIRADRTLGSRVPQAIEGALVAESLKDKESRIYHAFMLDVVVTLQQAP